MNSSAVLATECFEPPNAVHTLWRISAHVLEHRSITRMYLPVDALDECDSKSTEAFLRLIHKRTSMAQEKVQWVVSSRNKRKNMEAFSAESTLKAPVRDASLELKLIHLTKAVNTFITTRNAQLAVRKR